MNGASMKKESVVRGRGRGALFHMSSALLIGFPVLMLPLVAQPSAPLQTAQLLAEAREPVRIVCFGDSITGIYYHSGNRRAWPEMLEIALTRLYPKASLEVINAGVSGNTSAQGLARIQRDVLDRKPQLVVVMFGMNDLAYGSVSPERDAAEKAAFVNRLKTIITQCRAIDAEVILCTQNPICAEALPRRPPERVGEFAELIRRTGAELGVPVTDIYTEWTTLRKTTPRAWRLLMSETIHPAMAGHMRIAEAVAKTISGRVVSLSDVLPEQPVCGGLIARLKEGKPVKLAVPARLEPAIRAMVLRRFPSAALTIIPVAEEKATLAAAVEAYKKVRDLKPDFVFVSLAPELLSFEDEESFIRQVSWLIDESLPFSGPVWTAVGVDPILLTAGLTQKQQTGLDLFRDIVRGHDLDWIGQPADSSGSLQTVLNQWFGKQIEEK